MLLEWVRTFVVLVPQYECVIPGMQDRRIEVRMLCADLVEALWKDGRGRRAVVNLEDISTCGACIQHDHPIAVGTSVRLLYPGGTLVGTVRHCAFREIGFFIGLEFAANCRWSPKLFQPKHMVDPRNIRSYRDADPVEERPLVAGAAVGGGTLRKPQGTYIKSSALYRWIQPIIFMKRMAARLTD